MYVCLYVYLCVYIYICMYVCTYVCMYVCAYVRMYVCLYVYLCVYIYTCVCVCMSVCLSACLPACLSVCLSGCMSMYVYIYISMCVYVCMYVFYIYIYKYIYIYNIYITFIQCLPTLQCQRNCRGATAWSFNCISLNSTIWSEPFCSISLHESCQVLSLGDFWVGLLGMGFEKSPLFWASLRFAHPPPLHALIHMFITTFCCSQTFIHGGISAHTPSNVKGIVEAAASFLHMV